MAPPSPRIARALREAKLKMSQASVEDIDYPPRRELDKANVRQLASCGWVHEHQTALIIGATGTGKSYVACALAQQACRKGFRAIYRRAPRLFEELALARADGTYPRVLARFARFNVLVVDDFAIAPVTDVQREFRSDERERLSRQCVRDGVVVSVEAHIGRFSRPNGDDGVAIEAVRRQRRGTCNAGDGRNTA